MSDTLGQLITTLAARLQDPARVHWAATPVDELQTAILEALRTWNSLTMYARSRVAFTTTADQSWYDLTSSSSLSLAAAPIPQTVTDLDLVGTAQQRLLEPVGLPWAGSEQFSQQQLLTALQTRRDQFLGDTGCFLAASQIAASFGRTILPATVLDLRRLAWLDDAGRYTLLSREDEFTLNSFAPDWLVPGSPLFYSSSVAPPFQIQLAPPPGASGKIDLVSVNSGPALTGSGVVLGVPDDFSPYVLWGALADLLAKDGPARDLERSKYAATRYREGVVLARIFSSVLQAQINGAPYPISTVPELDSFSPTWQNDRGVPADVALMGLNLIATNPVASGQTAIELDFIANMPLPAALGDTITLGDDILAVLLDEAEHLACFKHGGEEFASTIPQHQRFVQLAAQSNGKLMANASQLDALRGKNYKVRIEHPEGVESTA